MNLERYLNQTPADVIWGMEEEISLEQYIGTLDILEERYCHLVDSLEQYDFIVDVAREHPDSPAFEGLGIEARTVLSVSTEDMGEWLKKLWGSLKKTIRVIIEKVRDFFGQLFSGYKNLIKKLDELKTNVNKKTAKEKFSVTVANPDPLLFEQRLSIDEIELALENNVTLGNFMEKEYVELAKKYYTAFMAQESKLSKTTEGPGIMMGKLIGEFNEGIERSKTIPLDKFDQTEMLGGHRLKIAKEKWWGLAKVITMHFENKEGTGSSREIEIRNVDDLDKVIVMAKQACEVASKSEKSAKELVKVRKEVVDAYDSSIEKGTFLQKITDRTKVTYFLRAANRDLTRVLQQYHRHNYQSCRAVVGLVSKAEKQLGEK